MINNTSPIIKHHAGLLNLAEERANILRANILKACKVIVDTFYCYQVLKD